MGSGRVVQLLALLGVLWLGAGSGADAQVVGLIACDPDVRFGNPTCPTGVCRRIGGICAGGALNFACLDDPTSGAATAPAPLGCAGVCTGSTGRCETDVRTCNTDFDCDPRESCLVGVCTTGACLVDSDCGDGLVCNANMCLPEPEPECRVDGDCQVGRLCIDQQCVPGECRGDWQCRTDEACIANDCVARCADDEVWVPNPIGFPPIPLGRCQKAAELIPCCYAEGGPLGLCSAFTSDCPVDHACAPSGVCYSLCGDGPCPGTLPRLPADVPPPDRWLDPRPPRPGGPILWRDDLRPWPTRRGTDDERRKGR